MGSPRLKVLALGEAERAALEGLAARRQVSSYRRQRSR